MKIGRSPIMASGSGEEKARDFTDYDETFLLAYSRYAMNL
jgi:hypothetical protein